MPQGPQQALADVGAVTQPGDRPYLHGGEVHALDQIAHLGPGKEFRDELLRDDGLALGVADRELERPIGHHVEIRTIAPLDDALQLCNQLLEPGRSTQCPRCRGMQRLVEHRARDRRVGAEHTHRQARRIPGTRFPSAAADMLVVGVVHRARPDLDGDVLRDISHDIVDLPLDRPVRTRPALLGQEIAERALVDLVARLRRDLGELLGPEYATLFQRCRVSTVRQAPHHRRISFFRLIADIVPLAIHVLLEEPQPAELVLGRHAEAGAFQFCDRLDTRRPGFFLGDLARTLLERRLGLLGLGDLRLLAFDRNSLALDSLSLSLGRALLGDLSDLAGAHVAIGLDVPQRQLLGPSEITPLDRALGVADEVVQVRQVTVELTLASTRPRLHRARPRSRRALHVDVVLQAAPTQIKKLLLVALVHLLGAAHQAFNLAPHLRWLTGFDPVLEVLNLLDAVGTGRVALVDLLGSLLTLGELLIARRGLALGLLSASLGQLGSRRGRLPRLGGALFGLPADRRQALGGGRAVGRDRLTRRGNRLGRFFHGRGCFHFFGCGLPYGLGLFHRDRLGFRWRWLDRSHSWLGRLNNRSRAFNFRSDRGWTLLRLDRPNSSGFDRRRYRWNSSRLGWRYGSGGGSDRCCWLTRANWGRGLRRPGNLGHRRTSNVWGCWSSHEGLSPRSRSRSDSRRFWSRWGRAWLAGGPQPCHLSWACCGRPGGLWRGGPGAEIVGCRHQQVRPDIVRRVGVAGALDHLVSFASNLAGHLADRLRPWPAGPAGTSQRCRQDAKIGAACLRRRIDAVHVVLLAHAGADLGGLPATLGTCPQRHTAHHALGSRRQRVAHDASSHVLGLADQALGDRRKGALRHAAHDDVAAHVHRQRGERVAVLVHLLERFVVVQALIAQLGVLRHLPEIFFRHVPELVPDLGAHRAVGDRAERKRRQWSRHQRRRRRGGRTCYRLANPLRQARGGRLALLDGPAARGLLLAQPAFDIRQFFLGVLPRRPILGRSNIAHRHRHGLADIDRALDQADRLVLQITQRAALRHRLLDVRVVHSAGDRDGLHLMAPVVSSARDARSGIYERPPRFSQPVRVHT